MAKILIVEDEIGLSGAICEWLEEDRYLVESVENGMDALLRLQEQVYDLIILDLMLPGMSGMEVCRRFRAGGGKTPILMLTARRSLADKEAGLDSGADDYLTKPFQLRELSARLRALLRRQPEISATVLQIGDLCLDLKSLRVQRGEQNIQLLPKELSLLELLMKNKGAVVSQDRIIDSIWGTGSNILPETLRSHIKMLRKKIDKESTPSLIRTVHGIGYIME